MESNRWLVVAFLAGGLLFGVAAYSAGLSHGAAHAAVTASADLDSADVYWGWNHGHGYWGFPFGGIIVIFFWVWIVRALFWGFRGPWGWRRRWRHYGTMTTRGGLMSGIGGRTSARRMRHPRRLVNSTRRTQWTQRNDNFVSFVSLVSNRP